MPMRDPQKAVSQAGIPGHRCRVLSQFLLAAALAYALAAAIALPQRPTLTGAATVFCAGAVPGLLVIQLLWMARPRVFRRPLRQLMVASTLAGAALVAMAPYLVVG